MDKRTIGGGLLTAISIIGPTLISMADIKISQDHAYLALCGCVACFFIGVALLLFSWRDGKDSMRKRGVIANNTGICRGGSFLKLDNAKGLDVYDNVSIAPNFLDIKGDVEDTRVFGNRHLHLDPNNAEQQMEATRRFFGGFSFSKGDHLKKS